jgi:hypothetical protein
MSWRGLEATCRRAARIADATLDGRPLTAADRVHLASCAACAREAERASGFLDRLALAAEAAVDDVPAPAPRGALRSLPRMLVPASMLAGAAAAGLLLAAVVGLRLSPPVAVLPLGSAATAEDRLVAMDLACGPVEGGTRCESVAPDHVHRVRLLERAGDVVGLEAGIIGTEGGPIDLRGADDLLRRMAVASLDGTHDAAATAWLAATYAGCAGLCSGDAAGMHLTLEKRDDAVILTIEAR